MDSHREGERERSKSKAMDIAFLKSTDGETRIGN
jgi:hypothetical protein